VSLKYNAGLSSEVAMHLQKVVNDAAREYFNR
jgi:hypothetical protein